MQISSAHAPAMNHNLMAAQQQRPTVEGTTVHADKQANAGAPAPAAPPSESRGIEQKTPDRAQGQNTKQAGQKTEEPKEKDPLKDTSSEEYAQVKELQARDAEVRAHEQAHLSAAGQYATGGPSFSYQTGPDGQQYAIGGEVGIDVSAIPDDPEATIAKMQVVQRAAMSPAEPSGQDVRVAAQAAQTASAARAELASQLFESRQDSGKAPEPETRNQQSATAKEAQSSYHEHQNHQEISGSFEAQA